MILQFLVRQITVYASVIGLSLFVGRKADPQEYALFNLINAFFGMSYILCDFGFGKSAIRSRLFASDVLLRIASRVNFILGAVFGTVVYLTLAKYAKFSAAPEVICLFIVASGLSLGSFYRMESSQRFDLIGRAEILQVIIYVSSFFLTFLISNNAVISIIVSSVLRSFSIPFSYKVFNKNVTTTDTNTNNSNVQEIKISRVLGLFADGFQYQLSQLLFISKDIVLLYILSSNITRTQQGFIAMAQTYSLLPILFIGPLSRVLLPRFSKKFDERNDAKPVITLSLVLLFASVIFSYLLYVSFPLFDMYAFNDKYADSYRIVKILVLVNIFTLPSIPIVSFLSVLLGYRAYLAYSILCVGVTWIVALVFPIYKIEDYLVPLLSGHAVNLLVVLAFYFSPKIKSLKGNYVA